VYELRTRNLLVQRQVPLPILYDSVKLDAGYRLDLLVESSVVVELKSVEAITGLHDAQILTYLRLSGHRLGYLINFNVLLFKQGVKRFVV
jgi:GxxExxY protein